MLSEKTDKIESLKKIIPFAGLDEEDLGRIVHFFQVVTFPAGSSIYSDGYPADSIYFIVSGVVRVDVHGPKKDRSLGQIGAGDRLGEEALLGDKLYATKAICLSEVTVFKLKASKARVIADAYPQVNNAFSLFEKTFQLMRKRSLPWRHESEAVDLFCRRHPFFLFLRIFLLGSVSLLVFSALLFAALASRNAFIPLLILSIAILLVGIGVSAWAGIEWSNDFFILTHERVAVQKKLIGFFESRHESPINAILSVGIDTSVWGRLFGYGTVTVRTYTGDLKFERLPFPYLIADLLEIRRGQAQEQEEQAAKMEIRAALTGSLASETVRAKKVAEKPYNDQIYQSGSFSDFLARLFRLRIQAGNVVTYRTHWWILFRKTFLPGTFMLVIALLLAARLIGFMSGITAVTVYVGGAILIFVGLLWWLYQYQDWQNDVYVITDDQLMDVYKKPLGNEDRRSAPVKNIQTVEFERKGLFGLIFNFGTVKIKIGNEELTFDHVYQPSVVQSEIYARYKAFQSESRRNEQQRFVDWIKTYDEIRSENENPPADEDEKG